MDEENWFKSVCDRTTEWFLSKDSPEDQVSVGRWHSMDVSEFPLLKTREILNYSFDVEVPDSIGAWKEMTQPNLPWAENHFKERVSGIPHNPPPSHIDWPWAHANAQHLKKNDRGEEKFSHTYPERFWPREAGHPEGCCGPQWGIRFQVGDLNDLVDHMIDVPLTRQAYLPIWFPEDLGAISAGERVPCTLGYHFLTRNGKTRINYFIRSCDFVRYFRDDIYMAGRLLQWVCERIHTKPGKLYFTCVSLHIMEGDVPKLRKELDERSIALKQHLAQLREAEVYEACGFPTDGGFCIAPKGHDGSHTPKESR